jgi:hydroxymethylpyrimidine pyrophosphatase-like HAD family hydrolase
VNAIKLLMARFNVKREETIAIGDNFNDKEMIEFAGIGIAMGNAPEEVKAIADYKTDTNNNNGVSKALNEIIGSSFKE